MFLLPEQKAKISSKCQEKIYSYLALSRYDVPVLKSVLLEEHEKLNEEKIQKIIRHIGANKAMMRFIYIDCCDKIKDGGVVVDINVESIKRELPDKSMAWLIEPTPREQNRCCVNIMINKELGTIVLEVLGQGFDISDINKGYITPHETITMPYPLQEGVMGEWWKWISVKICTHDEYVKSCAIRKKRCDEFGVCTHFLEYYRPIDLSIVEEIRLNIHKLADYIDNCRDAVMNASCSILYNGKFVFWDIQTPSGKRNAYIAQK